MRHKQQLVKIWARPSKDGKRFTYYLRYMDLEDKARCESLGHSDTKKAEKQRLKKEKELHMGFCPSGSMRLSEFIEDCLRRSGTQIRPSTKTEYTQAVNHLIEIIGDIDFQTVHFKHGEQFRQACLDKGNKPNTVSKKIRELHAVFQLAVDRKQLDENPFDNLSKPKSNNNTTIMTYTDDECDRLVRTASQLKQSDYLEWDMVIITALTTGLRKSEILNLVWSDIDFDEMTMTIVEKHNTDVTWEWRIKDTDHRTVPLTEELAELLINLQSRSAVGYPYVFVPVVRYNEIQQIRKGVKSKRGKRSWTYEDARISIIYRFNDLFQEIRQKARIQPHKTFHDIRRTAITNWFYEKLEINEVMRLAGHSKYDTTVKYYLSVKDDLMNKARKAVKYRVSREMLEKCLGE